MPVNFSQSVNFIQKEKKQKYLLIVFIVIVVLTFVFILFFSYFKDKIYPFPQALVNSSYKEIKINFNLLDDDFLKKSQSFDSLPSFKGQKGRENPFLPY